MNIKQIICIIIIIAFFMPGCATAPPGRQQISLECKTYSINGIDYVTAKAIAQNYNADYSWDPISRKFTIIKSGKEAIFCVGTDAALINDSLKRMPAAARMDSGKAMIPASFADSVLKGLFAPLRSYAKARKYISKKGRYTIRAIAIDPGHGGKDPGAISSSCGIREKDVVLDISKRLKEHLLREGIKVILTRDKDKFISLSTRPQISNNNNADFFISVHANACRSRYVSGIEVFYLSDAVDDAARKTAATENAAVEYENSSFRINEPKTVIAATLWDMLCVENRAESIELAQSISEGASQSMGIKNRGVKAAKFYVLKGAQMPAVLVEIGFITNANEALRLKNPVYRESLAKAIANGVLLYKKRFEETDGFTR